MSCLSGGERARILIAKLMLEPADILFLDEPTNDLDIPTLEVIEESLTEFAGAVVLISHDRCLMDRVCTQILGLGKENEQQFFADYSQWEQACAKRAQVKKETVNKSSAAPTANALAGNAAASSKPKKLSFKEQKELEGMERGIEVIEAEIAALHKQGEEPAVCADSEKSLEHYRLLAEAQHKLEVLFERWQYLLDKINPS